MTSWVLLSVLFLLALPSFHSSRTLAPETASFLTARGEGRFSVPVKVSRTSQNLEFSLFTKIHYSPIDAADKRAGAAGRLGFCGAIDMFRTKRETSC